MPVSMPVSVLAAKHSEGCWEKYAKKLVMGGMLLFVVVFVVALSIGGGVDWFLAAVMGISIVLLFSMNAYLVALWADPTDQTASLWQTLLIVTALSLAQGAILGLPLDVANQTTSLGCSGGGTGGDGPDCGNINMELFWEVVMCCIFGYVVVLLPWAIFQYEAYEEVEIKGKRTGSWQACYEAAKWEVWVLIGAGLAVGLLYGYAGFAEVPVTSLALDLADSDPNDPAFSSAWANGQAVMTADISTPAGLAAFTSSYVGTSQVTGSCVAHGCPLSTDRGALLEIRTTFAVYVAALTGWVGWFFFVVFGGIGLASVPSELIHRYTNRPVIKTPAELAEDQKQLQARTNELLRLGAELQRDRAEWAARGGHGWRERAKRRTADRGHVNAFKQMVFVLEGDYESWAISKGQVKDYNPLLPYLSLAAGGVAALLSLFWLLHIVLYVLVDPPVDLFLNGYFMQFDDWFPLFGTMSVMLFAGYLLVCVMSGLFKVGVRCLCLTIHPMRYGKTLMNSFMFNTMWILLCAIPVVQFCTEAFDAYARYTTIGTLLGVQVKYLRFFRYFFEDDVFIWCLLAIFALSLAALGYKPKDEAASSADLKMKIRAKR